MKPSGKRVSVKVIEAKIKRKKCAILLMKSDERMPFSDEVVDKFLDLYKGGVFIGYKLLPMRRKKR